MTVDPKLTSEKDPRFVKIVEAPEVKLGSFTANRKIINSIKKGLIGEFTRSWSSPNSTESWLNKTWRSLIKGEVVEFFCGNGFSIFLFEHKEGRDLIFKNGPYFTSLRGMF